MHSGNSCIVTAPAEASAVSDTVSVVKIEDVGVSGGIIDMASSMSVRRCR